MKFQYQGVTKSRESVNGVLEAEDEVEARVRLRSMNVRPLQLVVYRESFLKEVSGFSFTPPVTLKGLAVFTRQFCSLIESGVPIVQCLSILMNQERRPAFKRIIGNVKEELELGGGLASSLGHYPKAFSEFYVRIVEAGEVSGTLDRALKRLSQQLEKLGRLRSKVLGAAIYPTVTLGGSFIALLFMLIRVVPKVAELYANNNAELPTVTRYVMATSHLASNYLVHGILLGLLALAGFLTALKQPEFRAGLDRLLLRVPLVGDFILKSATALLTRTMATLVASGVPLMTTFSVIVRLANNASIRRALSDAAAAVSEGRSIASSLESSELFPAMVVQMIHTGEITGRLDEMLEKVAEIYDEEVDNVVQIVTSLIQPVLIFFVGGIVLFLLVAMYLPIFQMADKFSGGS